MYHVYLQYSRDPETCKNPGFSQSSLGAIEEDPEDFISWQHPQGILNNNFILLRNTEYTVKLLHSKKSPRQVFVN